VGVGLVFDILLAVLLTATIVYAAVLNKKLTQLRDSREEMEKLIGEFSQATAKAEESLRELKERAAASGEELETRVAHVDKQLETARGLADDLSFMVEKGGSIADRLEEGIREGRRLSGGGQAAAPAPDKRAAPRGGKDAQTRAGEKRSKTEPGSASDDAEGSPRSELLKTLDSLR
jgi:hypothetical protein